MLLTRAPSGWLVSGSALPDPGRCQARALWAYPVVGALVGAAGAVVFALCRWMGMPPGVAAVWALAGLIAVTGALHEDGLADVADGFGGGHTRERKLEIMRDSRIGSYGALALILSTAIRGAAIAALATPGRAAPALIAAGALSRAGMAVPVLLLHPARGVGLGAMLGGATAGPALAGFALAGAAAAVLLPAGAAASAAVVAVLVALGVGGLARAQIGGFTGDVLGACSVAIECAVLTVLACGA
jgi:adenosylcobinamide-GDP ribazoletransferase